MSGWNEDWTTRAVQPITTIFKDITTAAAAADSNGGGNGGGGGGNGGVVGGGGGDGGGGNVNGGNSVVCDEWIEHPVLVVQRDTFANFFHDR